MNPSLSLITAALVSLPLMTSKAPKTALGTPLLCQEFSIGDARSLAWGHDNAGLRGYDRSRLVADVEEILKTEPDLIVRLETLRRAALYTRGDRALAWELLGRIGLGVLEQAAISSKEAIAWFDVGYLAAALEQMGTDLGFRAGVAENQEGYAYMLRALERAREERSDQVATIEFVAALLVHPSMRPSPTAQDVARFERHFDAARAGAAPGSLLAQNLAAYGARSTGNAKGAR
jgi:hypothetical protein